MVRNEKLRVVQSRKGLQLISMGVKTEPSCFKKKKKIVIMKN